MLHYFEQAAKHAMKYEGRYFMEFLRRVIDFPRRNVIDPFNQNPNFAELVNRRLARAYGATVSLPEGVYFGLDKAMIMKQASPRPTGKKHKSRLPTNYRISNAATNTTPHSQKAPRPPTKNMPPTRPPTYITPSGTAYIGEDSQPLSGGRVTSILEANAPEALTDLRSKLPE